MVAQPAMSSSGLRKMPPPTPVSPESKPNAPPATMATGIAGGVGDCGSGRRVTLNNRHAAMSKTTPTMMR